MVAYPNTQTAEIYVVVKYTGAQTDTEVIAAPASGTAILLLDYQWSCSGNQEVFLEQGAALVAGSYTAINTSQSMSGNPSQGSLGGRELTTATNLTITTVGAFDTYLEILYTIVTG